MKSSENQRRDRSALLAELEAAGADVSNPATLHCPFHDDANPSAGVYEDKGIWRFKCQADACGVGGDVFDLRARRTGRPVGELLSEANAADRANGRTRRDRRQIEATYDYRRADGKLAFQVVRYKPKDFRQRRPDGRGGWTWRLNGTPRVLYRLPEVLAADDDAWVFVVEGEKDADRLASLGLVATTCPQGAGKWSKLSDDSALHGRRVAIVPDNDDAGRRHGQAVAWALDGKAAEMKLIALPELAEHGDVSDWLDAGGTAERVVELTEAAEPWSDDAGAADADADDADAAGETGDGGTPTQSAVLVKLALERYRIGRTDADEPFAVEYDGPNIARLFRGSRDALRSAMARDYRRRFGRVPNASALADAITVLVGEAEEADAEPVALRVADHEGGVVLDLGDATGRAVMIDAEGWRVLERSPVLFRRTALTGVMPPPEPGGTLVTLRRMLNVSEETWPLVLGWLVAAFREAIAHPILLLGGEQGTGKSTAARFLVEMFDPSPAALRSEPRDSESWAMTAAGSWAVAIDNVSTIPPWFSDALCKAVTGDGWVRRKLYTDSELAVLSYRRVVAMTSIDAGALRGDLADRLLMVELERISDRKRRGEAEIDRLYHAERPAILGALLDLVAKVLSVLPSVKLEAMPRMADFARVLAALDELGETAGALDMYLGQRDRLASDVVADDPVASALRAFVDRVGDWDGTAGELLDHLTPTAPPRDWPRSARALAGRMRTHIPALRAVGVEIDEPRPTDRPRHYRLRYIRAGQGEGDDAIADGRPTVGDGRPSG